MSSYPRRSGQSARVAHRAQTQAISRCSRRMRPSAWRAPACAMRASASPWEDRSRLAPPQARAQRVESAKDATVGEKHDDDEEEADPELPVDGVDARQIILR